MGLTHYRDASVTAMPQGARKLLDIAVESIGTADLLDQTWRIERGTVYASSDEAADTAQMNL